MGRSILWSISLLRHQMFYPFIAIFAAQVTESDDLRRALLPFLFFLSCFSGVQRILGYGRPWRIVAVHPLKTGNRRPHCGVHLEVPLNWDSLRAALWRNWPSIKCSSEGCRAWIETQQLSWWQETFTSAAILSFSSLSLKYWKQLSTCFKRSVIKCKTTPFFVSSQLLPHCHNYAHEHTDTERTTSQLQKCDHPRSSWMQHNPRPYWPPAHCLFFFFPDYNSYLWIAIKNVV